MLRPDPPAPQLGFLFEEPRPSRRIWPVRELVAQVRDLIERQYADVWVEGEISNFRPAPSGHVYFTLKDADAQLPVVLFRRQAILLRFRPEDGLHVLVRGHVSVYEQRGQMQLVAETMEPVGAGSLQLAFEQLKEKLKAEGLFDADRKRPLPAFPRTVGIVTSPTGAVIRDFLSIVARRHSGLNVLLVPVSVQGDQAPAEIESAIASLNAANLVDVIVLARGGGSLEDLAAFNSERVARAIAASPLPIVSAVGHETDFTIADFAADLRAPTPSAAAELITEAQHRIGDHHADLRRRLDRAARFQLLQFREALSGPALARAGQRLSTRVHRHQQRLDELTFRLESAMTETLRDHRESAARHSAALLSHDPRHRIAHARAALSGWTSRLAHALDRSRGLSGAQIHHLENRLYRSAQVHLAVRRSAWHSLHGQLHSLSPLAVLDRGYALVQNQSGALVRSVAQLTAGQTLLTRLADGQFTSQIKAIAPAIIESKDKITPP